MRKIEFLVDIFEGRLMVAVLEKGRMIDLYADPLKPQPAPWASLWLGRVERVDPRLDAAFINLGDGGMGFLPAKHVHTPGADQSETRSGINNILKSGQMLLVQVKAEAYTATSHEHQKYPRLTTKLYIPGRVLGYSPHSNKVNVSRRIQNEAVFAVTKQLEGSGGWILQPAADYTPPDVIKQEASILKQRWKDIQTKGAHDKTSPRLLMAAPNALERALIDYGGYIPERIEVSDRLFYAQAEQWLTQFAPHTLGKETALVMYSKDKDGLGLFDFRDISSEIDTLTAPTVALPSDGNLIIEQTSSLVSVDVNRAGGESAVAVNAEAATEVCRQIRLRNLCGAILIDFINMSLKTDRSRILEILEKEFEEDVTGTQIHGFTRLGIMEMTRKRRDSTLAEKLKA